MAGHVTLEEIRRWPPTCDITAAAGVLGVSKSAAYEAVRAGSFPVATLRIGRRLVVITDDLVAHLERRASRVA